MLIYLLRHDQTITTRKRYPETSSRTSPFRHGGIAQHCGRQIPLCTGGGPISPAAAAPPLNSAGVLSGKKLIPVDRLEER